jgi:hypothetical protein
MALGNFINLSLFFSAFIRSYERLQSDWTHVWGLSTNDTVQSDSWHEVHLCCLMPAIRNPETFWWSLCTWYFKTNDNVSFSSRLESPGYMLLWVEYESSFSLLQFSANLTLTQTYVH